MKSSKRQYYSLVEDGDVAVLNIFGDITSYPWEEFGEMSNVLLSKKLEELGKVNTIDVFINSYGGEVAEGLAIYNALKRHSAKIRTHVDGFACSIASVIFMAGDERIMPSTSCLMIHNPWTIASGNAIELRKQADDLDVIGECSINAYMERVNISEEELKELLDNETWISPDEAVEKGFATSKEESEDNSRASQSVKNKVQSLLLAGNKEINQKINNIKSEDSSNENDDNSCDEESDTENVIAADDENNNLSQKAIEYIEKFFSGLEREMLK